jgi:predicted amidohydrolase
MNKKKYGEPDRGMSWSPWAPRREISPVFSRETETGRFVLVTASNGKPGCFGKWICRVPEAGAGETYRFSIRYSLWNLRQEHTAAVVTWVSGEGIPLTRQYAEPRTGKPGRWKEFYLETAAPSDSYSAILELHFRWSRSGAVQWKNPVFETVPPKTTRGIRICTTRMSSFSTDPGENEERVLRLIEEASAVSPDIICLTETPCTNSTRLPLEKAAQPVPGECTARISEKAAKHGCYIIFSLLEKSGNRYYNTALLFNRTGEIAGKYRKTHLALVEAEKGITPGHTNPVFDTDFGRIGILICWDHWFPETARILRIKGAEIIFVPTQRNGAQDESILIQSQARAADNGVYIVVSGVYGKHAGTIIDPSGKIIAETAPEGTGFVSVDLDLSKEYLVPHLSVGCNGDGKNIYLAERRPETYGILSG